jgi:predicted O-methyltransferase YrrM
VHSERWDSAAVKEQLARVLDLARRSAWARSTRQFVKTRLNLLDRADVHQLKPLQLNDLYQECDLWTESPEEILQFMGLDLDPAYWSQFLDVSEAIALRATQISLHYPNYFDVAPRSGQLLFHLVRARRPQIVVETGIANGRSSAMILAAMDLNGAGTLHSIDINDDVGALVPHQHPRWVKHIGDGSPAALQIALKQCGPVDIFLHDSDHRYRAQLAEYEIAERHGSSEFLLASDDVNWSNAFLDHCKKDQLTSAVLSDVNKCFGVAWRRTK